MSGPVRAIDAADEPDPAPTAAATVEVMPARTTEVGGLPVRRALPKRTRRTVGAWCFVDHLGPTAMADDVSMQVGPHPHIGLHTATWLLAGEALHRDSLGTEQLLRPGQLNLMTAGNGIAHAEETPPTYRGPMHAVQLWVAQPDDTRHGEPAFEHHVELPVAALGPVTATVLLGEVAGARSTARTDTPLVGAQLVARAGRAVVPLDAGFEHAVVVLDGRLSIDGHLVGPGALAYLGLGRHELLVEAADGTTALLLGGTPFESPVQMWWNFVARTPDEVAAAAVAWNAGDDDRFGSVASPLPRIPAPES